MTVQSYIAENARFHRDPAQVELIAAFTDEQLAAVLEANAAAGGCDDFIDLGLVATRESLGDYDAARAEHWQERGSREAITCAGRPAVLYENFQVLKGQPRVSAMVVVDLGDRRVAVR